MLMSFSGCRSRGSSDARPHYEGGWVSVHIFTHRQGEFPFDLKISSCDKAVAKCY